MALTARERKIAQRERERRGALRKLTGKPTCECCGEHHVAFLRAYGSRIYCANCAAPIGRGELCPHQGISGHLG